MRSKILYYGSVIYNAWISVVVTRNKLMYREDKLILKESTKLFRFSNTVTPAAAALYERFNASIGCTYLIYMHEDLITNEKRVYTSNWDWQDLLIGEKLINNCPVFLSAFNYLEHRNSGAIFLPWNNAPPKNQEEREVCGVREEHNIANGFGFGGKGNGVRETLAFGGNKGDKSFHMNFIAEPELFNNALHEMRRIILTINDPSQQVRVSTGVFSAPPSDS